MARIPLRKMKPPETVKNAVKTAILRLVFHLLSGSMAVSLERERGVGSGKESKQRDWWVPRSHTDLRRRDRRTRTEAWVRAPRQFVRRISASILFALVSP
ncbi:hypothetical protein AXF42_Ash009143 [Apostasia shenzhenica]|uniref:Uncharacterized protein n=1 Tax=Apostasia shenzhenica TaxID=1088818 RepID=A0A2I0ADM1_9ASPA|nr:hypothetical protein AXF42_Ash009143 [Apostasia shenzhenica]